jgi:hypothetical protein
MFIDRNDVHITFVVIQTKYPKQNDCVEHGAEAEDFKPQKMSFVNVFVLQEPHILYHQQF